MRVVTATDRSRIGVKTAGIRTVTFLIGPALFLLVAGPLNLLVGAALAQPTPGCRCSTPAAQCLHDKLAGTIVVRQRWLDQQAPW